MNNTKKKTAGSWGVLCLALVAGGAAFWLSHDYLNNQEASLRERLLGGSSEMRQVVVAMAPVRAGDVIGPHNMAMAEVGRKHLSAASVTPDFFHLYEGQIVRHDMSPGEPLLDHFVAGDAISRFSELLGNGERAVTVQVGELTSSAGMLTTGDYVDLFLMTSEPKLTGGPQNEKSLLLLRERVRILSVGQDSLRSREQDFTIPEQGLDRYATVTIGVPREDAARIALAEQLGDMVFMLRGPNDKLIHGDELLSQSSLWQQLAQTRGTQYFTNATNSSGALIPAFVPATSVGTKPLRQFQKSVALSPPAETAHATP